jgi:hypothetical protein
MNYNTSPTQAQLSYEVQLKKFYVANVINVFFYRYNKNYNNRMYIEEVAMNMTNGCHMNLLTIF